MSSSALNHTAVEVPNQSVSPAEFRDGMAHLAGAVNIVTTCGETGPAGFTATAVCSVSDNPATMLVCLNRNSSVHKVFEKTSHLVINTLTPAQQDLSNLFGGKAPMEARFAAANWESLVSGSPVLCDAAVAFDCKVTQVLSVATHDVFFCQVLAIKQQPSAGALLYHKRQYRHLHNTSE